MPEPDVATWALRRCPKCDRYAYVPAGAYCTFHANQRVPMVAADDIASTRNQGPRGGT